MNEGHVHAVEGRPLNILVVFKKNFEEVHDEGLMELKAILQTAANDTHQVDYKPRNTCDGLTSLPVISSSCSVATAP